MTILEQIANMSPLEKENFLREQATQIMGEATYNRPLTPEEMVVAKEEFTETSIVLTTKTEEFSEVKAEFKAEEKILKAELSHKLFMVRNGHEKMKGELFHFADQDLGTMTVLDKYGNVIEERKLRPNERQTSIMSAMKTGTI